MLPQVLLDLIDAYVQAFDLVESLPSVRAIRDLILKSNANLLRIATHVLIIPMHVMMEIVLQDTTEVFDMQYIEIIIENTDLIAHLDDVISCSMMSHFATPALFWLFIQKSPTLYFGPYGVMFEQSLLFKLINIITNA